MLTIGQGIQKLLDAPKSYSEAHDKIASAASKVAKRHNIRLDSLDVDYVVDKS